MRTKLVATLDIVLSSRLIHAEIERTVEQAHKVCDPHLAISLANARQTVSNPVDMAVELEMLDAAIDLSKENLAEIEGLKRSIAKSLQGHEVLEALGSALVSQDMIDAVEEKFQVTGLRLEEMEKLRDLTVSRARDLTSQL